MDHGGRLRFSQNGLGRNGKGRNLIWKGGGKGGAKVLWGSYGFFKVPVVGTGAGLAGENFLGGLGVPGWSGTMPELIWEL